MSNEMTNKQPEPGEFTAWLRKVACRTESKPAHQSFKEFSSIHAANIFELAIEACDIIDRLSAENESYKAMKEGVEIRIGDLNAELKAKDEEIERLRIDLLRIDNYCRVNDIEIEQALKGQHGKDA